MLRLNSIGKYKELLRKEIQIQPMLRLNACGACGNGVYLEIQIQPMLRLNGGIIKIICIREYLIQIQPMLRLNNVVRGVITSIHPEFKYNQC